MLPFVSTSFLIKRLHYFVHSSLQNKSTSVWLTGQQKHAELMENMDKKSAWDRFYSETNSRSSNFKNFEWFFGFDAVQDLITPLLQTASLSRRPVHVLDLGCGTSALGPSIYRDSALPVRVICADISTVAVRLMREHLRANPVRPRNASSQIEFLELDCTQLDTYYHPRSLDLIVDKGTTDALLKSKEGAETAASVLRQCLTTLRRSGSLLQFSDEDPDARLVWLETAARGLATADVGLQEVGVLMGVCYYCYHVTAHNDVNK